MANNNLLEWANAIEKQAGISDYQASGAAVGGLGGAAIGGLLPLLLTTKDKDDLDESDFTKRKIRNAILGALVGGGLGVVGGGAVGTALDPSVQQQNAINDARMQMYQEDARANQLISDLGTAARVGFLRGLLNGGRPIE